jgi:putative membrane protein
MLRAMAERDFFQPEAKKKTGLAIKAIESKTSVEVVVAMRHRVAEYRSTDLMFGFVCACAALAALWFSPSTYAVEHMPFEMLGAFVVGAALSAFVHPLRRAMTPKSTVTRQLDVAARAAFYDLGISKTHRRTGLLLFASMYEGAVVLVPDAAVDKKALLELTPAKQAIEGAIRTRDLDAFLKALEQITPPLEKAMPRKAGDENELPDEPQ